MMDKEREMTINTNLLVGVNMFNRVGALLDTSRAQLSKEDLLTISNYLVKILKYIDDSLNSFNCVRIPIGNCIESIDSVLNSDDFFATNSKMKSYIVNTVGEALVSFKINVGVYLTEHEFDYKPNQDRVLQDIVDTCIEHGYYFGL